MLGFALTLAFGRVYIKTRKFHKLFIDDAFFISATVFLVAGAIMTLLLLPYNQTQVNVRAGVEAPPPDLVHQLDLDVKYEDAALFLLNASIYSVKFSFLFFFRLLLTRTGRLQMWWWCVFVFTIPCAGVCMCTEFMACPAFGSRIIS